MITQAESGLTEEQYAAIQAATGDLSVKVVLQRYGSAWATHDTSERAGSNFDAAIASGHLLRVYVAGTADVVIERLSSESEEDQEWTVVANSIDDISTAVPPTLATNGLTARLFYYSADGKIRYVECVDVSSGVFGAAQDVGTVASVRHLAAVSLTRVYYTTYNDTTYNRRFHCYQYNGSWASTSSDIYWPFPIRSLDAVTLSDCDLLMIATELPPLLGSRVVGAEVTLDVRRVQGIATFRVANGRWSDHDVLDVTDRIEADPARGDLRLSYVNGILFATYTRRGGTGDFGYTKLAVTRSKDGRNWEFPELVDTITAPGVVLPRADYLYLAGVDATYRSPRCAWAGQTPVELEVTDSVLNVRSQATEIRETTAELANVADVLAETLAASGERVQAVHEIGYVTDGEVLRTQVSIEDLAVRTKLRGLPRRTVGLTGRDRLGRLNTTVSDYAAEWPGQQAGRDAYNDPTNTGYGGLRHTAPIEGSWKASHGACELVSSSKEGIAVSTFVADALNGGAQAGFLLNNTDKGEYAGITFRVHDKDNFFYVAYFADDNKIRLRKAVGGTATTLATSAAMGWTINGANWYYLRVRVRYNMVYVYTGTDGVTWTALSWASGSGELLGCPSAVATELAVWTGKFGLIGYGYSDRDSWPGWEPSPWPAPIPLPQHWGVVVLSQSQLARSWDFFDVEDPSWEDISGGLTGTFYHIEIGPTGQAYVSTSTGLWYTNKITAASISWTCIKTDAAAAAEAGYDGTFGALDVMPGGTVYAVYHTTAVAAGFFSGTAAALAWTGFPKWGAVVVKSPLIRTSFSVYARGGAPYIGCGTGGGNGALLYSGGDYTYFTGEGAYVRGVSNGYSVSWDGNLYSGYAPGPVYTSGVSENFGVHDVGGKPLYMKDLHRYLYQGLDLVAAAESVFGAAGTGGSRGGRAIHSRYNEDETIWVHRDLCGPLHATKKFIVYTDDGWVNFADKTGNFFTAIGNWAGADGSSGANGNASVVTFPYSDGDL